MLSFTSFSVLFFDVQTAHVVLREKEKLSSCSRAVFLCFLFCNTDNFKQDKTPGVFSLCLIYLIVARYTVN